MNFGQDNTRPIFSSSQPSSRQAENDETSVDLFQDGDIEAGIQAHLASGKSLQDIIALLVSEKQSALSQSDQMWKIIEKQRTIVQQLQSQASKAVEEETKLRAALSEATNRVKTLEGESLERDEEFAEARRVHESTQQGLNSKIGSLQSEIAQLQTRLEETQRESSQLYSQLSDSQRETADLRSQLNETFSALPSLQGEANGQGDFSRSYSSDGPNVPVSAASSGPSVPLPRQPSAANSTSTPSSQPPYSIANQMAGSATISDPSPQLRALSIGGRPDASPTPQSAGVSSMSNSYSGPSIQQRPMMQQQGQPFYPVFEQSSPLYPPQLFSARGARVKVIAVSPHPKDLAAFVIGVFLPNGESWKIEKSYGDLVALDGKLRASYGRQLANSLGKLPDRGDGKNDHGFIITEYRPGSFPPPPPVQNYAVLPMEPIPPEARVTARHTFFAESDLERDDWVRTIASQIAELRPGFAQPLALLGQSAPGLQTPPQLMQTEPAQRQDNYLSAPGPLLPPVQGQRSLSNPTTSAAQGNMQNAFQQQQVMQPFPQLEQQPTTTTSGTNEVVSSQFGSTATSPQSSQPSHRNRGPLPSVPQGQVLQQPFAAQSPGHAYLGDPGSDYNPQQQRLRSASVSALSAMQQRPNMQNQGQPAYQPTQDNPRQYGQLLPHQPSQFQPPHQGMPHHLQNPQQQHFSQEPQYNGQMQNTATGSTTESGSAPNHNVPAGAVNFESEPNMAGMPPPNLGYLPPGLPAAPSPADASPQRASPQPPQKRQGGTFVDDNARIMEQTPPGLQPLNQNPWNAAARKNSNKKGAIWGKRKGSESSGSKTPDSGKVVFGIPLEVAVENSRLDEFSELPAVVYRCIEYLEARNAKEEEGIYRLSGSNVVIQGLKEKFNSSADVDLLRSGEPYDVHAVAGLLKLYLRELPSTVLTKNHQRDFLRITEIADRDDRITELSRQVSALPLPNYTLLSALIAHLVRIVQCSERNKMTVRNVGIVFSPTLGVPANIMTLMLAEYDLVFCWDDPVKANVAKEREREMLERWARQRDEQQQQQEQQHAEDGFDAAAMYPAKRSDYDDEARRVRRARREAAGMSVMPSAGSGVLGLAYSGAVDEVEEEEEEDGDEGPQYADGDAPGAAQERYL
ncbi:hypothetical protein HK405_002239 [Cladochytrium tenue]|nr:hypothetical protein HK405_002239 [Cladochytrium tenue]